MYGVDLLVLEVLCLYEEELEKKILQDTWKCFKSRQGNTGVTVSEGML